MSVSWGSIFKTRKPWLNNCSVKSSASNNKGGSKHSDDFRLFLATNWSEVSLSKFLFDWFFSRVFIFHLKLNFDSIFRWARALGHKLEPRLHKSLVLLERWDKLQKTTMPAWITFSTLLKMVWLGMRKHFVCLVLDISSDLRLSDGWAAVVAQR